MYNSRSVNWPLLAGLRFFLAWIVMTAHVDFYAPGGIAAAFYMFGAKASVAAFLLISGFSIAASIESRPQGFILRRLLRIYPLYFASLLLTLFVQSFIVSTMDNPIFPADSWGKIIGNMFMTQMFFVKALVYNGPFWSLSIEFFFYVLAPIFCFMKKRYLYILIAISGIVYILPNKPEASIFYIMLLKFNALKYLWIWLLGFCLYKREPKLDFIGGILCITLLVLSSNFTHKLNIVTLGGTYLILLFSHYIKIGDSAKNILNYLGDLSYPLYLMHFPLILLVVYGLNIKSEFILYSVIFLTTSLSIIIFDVYVKNKLFKPLFTRILSSSIWTKKLFSYLPRRIAVSYRI
ncbi:acyltransferase family protein [Agarilytica rhodophyticola]|uniref:acyltransferase family protein n=1 Tax=Agarilytica rhodophyticola TaxID=1737490 RepID=UPI000B343CED|nr:acyltransferase [Agarilytica rhodophyticola]